MDDTRSRPELIRCRVEARPGHASALAAAIEPFEQELTTSVNVLTQAPAVATDSKVLEMATEMLWNMLHHGPSEQGTKAIQTHTEFLQLLPYAFALSLATHHEPPTTASRNEVCEAKEAKGFGLTQSLSFALRYRLIAKT